MACPRLDHRRYLDFDVPVHRVKAHQTLAINRGEKKKILTVRLGSCTAFGDSLVTTGRHAGLCARACPGAHRAESTLRGATGSAHGVSGRRGVRNIVWEGYV